MEYTIGWTEESKGRFYEQPPSLFKAVISTFKTTGTHFNKSYYHFTLKEALSHLQAIVHQSLAQLSGELPRGCNRLCSKLSEMSMCKISIAQQTSYRLHKANSSIVAFDLSE